MEEKSKFRKLQPNWASLIDCVWLIIISTSVYLADGSYPSAYLLWIVILAISGGLIPWAFVEKSFFVEERKW